MQIKKRYLPLCIAMAATGVSGSVLAKAQLEEIVVTAEFRETNLQETPIAITAMTGDDLDAAGIDGMTSLNGTAPNVTISQSSNHFGPASIIYIRGVGQADSSFFHEQGVGLYVDDVYHGTILGGLYDLFDLERVEVLRGPQGTLAGKNSIGGALKFHSVKPQGDDSGYVELTYGDFDRTGVRASYDTALIEDTLFMRLSGMSKSYDGHVDRIDFGCAHPNLAGDFAQSTNSVGGCKIGEAGGKDTKGVRAALRWVASEDVDINLSVDKVKEDSDPTPSTLVFANWPGYTEGGIPFDERFISSNPYQVYSGFFYDDPGTSPEVYSATPGVQVDSEGASLIVDWDISDTLSLKAITGYRSFTTDYSYDQDLSPLSIVLGDFNQSHEQLSQELRLSGIVGDFLDWTLGAYYYTSESELNSVVISNGSLNQDSAHDFESESQSIFAHTVWHLTDSTNLTLGIRYTDDEKIFDMHQTSYFARGVGAIPGGVAGTVDGIKTAYTGDSTDWRVSLDHQWNDTLMTYAQVSTGYRAGGLNPRPFDASQVVTYEPETMTAYEAGLKVDLFDNTLRLNTAVFLNEYEDIVMTSTSPCCGSMPFPLAAVPMNAGTADITGVELEYDWRPIEGLFITGNASWLDFEYQSVNVSSIDITDVAPFTPEFKAALTVGYEFALSGGSTLTPRLDVTYQDEMWSNAENKDTSPLIGGADAVDSSGNTLRNSDLVDSYTLANASLTWVSANGDWETRLAVSNLADKEYYIDRFNAVRFNGQLLQTIGRPREWSITFKRNF